MLPQSHIVIATHLYESIKKNFNVELDKKNLVYGSIKPDIPLHLAGLKHFKPQSFNHICNEIYQLSQLTLADNKEHIKLFSKKIGIVTHYVADYFCVPHNDRKTYKSHFLNHLQYENNLHKFYQSYQKNTNITSTDFNIDNRTSYSIQSLLDTLHSIYSLKEESFVNDFESSMEATNLVASYIVYHTTINNYHNVAA